MSDTPFIEDTLEHIPSEQHWRESLNELVREMPDGGYLKRLAHRLSTSPTLRDSRNMHIDVLKHKERVQGLAFHSSPARWGLGGCERTFAVMTEQRHWRLSWQRLKLWYERRRNYTAVSTNQERRIYHKDRIVDLYTIPDWIWERVEAAEVETVPEYRLVESMVEWMWIYGFEIYRTTRRPDGGFYIMAVQPTCTLWLYVDPQKLVRDVLGK